MPVGRRGGHADPQTGERPWAATDHDGVEVVDGEPGVGERAEHVRGQLLGVRAGVDGDPLGEHLELSPSSLTTPAVTAGVAVSIARITRAHGRLHCQMAVRTSVSGPRSSRMSRWLLGEPLGEPFSPLDDHDGVVEVGVEVQRVEFAEQVGGCVVEQPVHVDVDHRRGARPARRMHPGQHERRRGDRALDIHRLGDSLGQHGFSRTQRPDSTTTSPARSCSPSWAPNAMVSSAVGSSAVPRADGQPWRRTRSRSRRVSATSLDGVARSTRRTSASSMASGCSSCTRCPAPPTITSSDFGSAAAIALRVLHRGEQVAVAAGDQRGHLRQRRQPRGLVVHLERVQELHQRGDRRVVHHLLGERHDARADLLVAVGRRPQDRGDHRLGGAAGAVHGLRRVPDREAGRLQRRVLQDLAER